RVKKSLVQPSEASFEDPHHLRLTGCASVICGRHEGPGLLDFDHDDGFDPVDELRTPLAKPTEPFHEPVRPGGVNHGRPFEAVTLAHERVDHVDLDKRPATDVRSRLRPGAFSEE